MLEFSLCSVHSLGFDLCIMVYIHHQSIIQNTFTALIILCILLIRPSLPSPLIPTKLPTLSIHYFENESPTF